MQLFSLVFLFFSITNISEKQAVRTDTIGEAKKLIQQVLIWSESTKSIVLLPAIPDETGKVYIGFDMQQHKENLKDLKEINLFTNEFIKNYNQIIKTLNKALREKKIEKWLVGDLPPFNFANDISPWCQCQGFSVSDFDDAVILKDDNIPGELIWKWAQESSWKGFKFRIKVENQTMKVDYLEGFDLKYILNNHAR